MYACAYITFILDFYTSWLFAVFHHLAQRSLNLLQPIILTILLALLYLISYSIPFSEHTYKYFDKLIDEGAMSTKLLINEEPIIHPVFTLYNLLLRSSM